MIVAKMNGAIASAGTGSTEAIASFTPFSPQSPPGPLTPPAPTIPAIHPYIAFSSSPESNEIRWWSDEQAEPNVAKAVPPIPLDPVAPEPEPELTAEQHEIVNRVLKRESVFFTGPAGCGKSVVVRAIIAAFDSLNAAHNAALQDPASRSAALHEGPWRLAVTASTGLAGMNIGGTTLHSWAGIGLGKLPAATLASIIEDWEPAACRWRETDALLIDEISMIDGHLLTKLDYIGKRLRGDHRPFGGLQIILSGDFFQLGPISDDGEPPAIYAFEAPCWSEIFLERNIMILDTVFRQDEAPFINLLANMRKGAMRMEDYKIVNGADREIMYEDGIEPVCLFSTRKQVQKLNQAKLDAIQDEVYLFKAVDFGGKTSSGERVGDEEATTLLNRDTRWLESVDLKVGAQVMLVTNLRDGGLVNGSLGRIVAFQTRDEASQTGVLVVPGDSVDPAENWPVIEFLPSKHCKVRQYQRVLIPRMIVQINNANNTMEACRLQVPLILAWAITIHKSQGQSIPRLRIDLDRIFACGQMYVAFSRATSLETLEVRHFHKKRLKASHVVLRWYRHYEELQVSDEYAKATARWNTVLAKMKEKNPERWRHLKI